MEHVRNYPIRGLDGLLNVKIVAVETPWRIYATRDDEAEAREAFLLSVQSYDRTLLHRLLEEEIFRGSLVFANIDNVLYRGTVQDQTNNVEDIQVWLGDYAVEVTMCLDNLYVMPSFAKLVPWQVFACGILDVCPIDGGEWPVDTCDGLRECLVGHNVFMRVWFPDVSAEAIWVDILWDDGDKRISIVDVMLDIRHADRATCSREFDWGCGVGSFTDRRRSLNFDRKLSSRGSGRTVGFQEARSAYTATIEVDEEEEDEDGPQSYEDDSYTSNIHGAENSYGESSIQRTSNWTDGYNSCGETLDDSDVE